MPKVYTIGSLARAAGVPVSTVRFYERARIFRPDARSRSNYRQYTDRSLGRLTFIRSAQATGFSLRDIRELLQLSDSPKPPCRQIETLLRTRLSEVRRRIDELRQMERALKRAVRSCCRNRGPDLCAAVVKLGNGKACQPDACENSCC